MLSITKLGFVRNNTNLFSNITFKLAAGEILHVHGGNGCGKTTLLKLLATILLPDQGQIKYNSRQILPRDSAYLQTMLYLGHRANYHLDLSVLENIVYANKLANLDARDNCSSALAYFNLSSYQNCKLTNLSCGQLKQLSLCRLKLRNATIWLLDEPFANLDMQAQELLLALIQARLNDNGIVIFTSHQAKIPASLNAKSLNLEVTC